MPDWNELIKWLGSDHDQILWTLAIFSLLAFVVSLLALPWLVKRLPVDFFSNPQSRKKTARHPVWALLVAVSRNVLALVLLLAGIAMLFLPGQGLLTIVIAIVLLDFPGKYALERRLVSRPGVFKALNWLRRKGGREAFEPVREKSDQVIPGSRRHG